MANIGENSKIDLKFVLLIVTMVISVVVNYTITQQKVVYLEEKQSQTVDMLKELRTDFKDYKKEHYEKIDRIYQELLQRQ
jgi:hypothetical protein